MLCHCVLVVGLANNNWTRTYTQTVYNTKGTRAHTHRELIREWLYTLSKIDVLTTRFCLLVVSTPSGIL